MPLAESASTDFTDSEKTQIVKALLLGAGASYDCGMPLVWELTAELRRWLTKPKLAEVNNNWRLHGDGWNDHVVAELEKVLDASGMHYEDMIGYIEVLFSRERDVKARQELWGVHTFLLQAVYHMLLKWQVENAQYALSALDDYRGIRKVAEYNRPLWVFSLNHDLITEMLASKLSIPIKSGFSDRASLAMRSDPNVKAQEVNFEYLSRDSIDHNAYDFFRSGEYGINLIKLHGALDIFGYRDELNYLKILPTDNRPESYIDRLSLVREVDLDLARNRGVYAVNETSYLDESGEVQFLRHSLLSGAHKFSSKIAQIAPSEFLSLFRGNVNSSDELVCIGYSFGDSHIDQVLKDWLSSSADNKLTIVNPGMGACPRHFNYLSSQVSCMAQSADEYFMSIEGTQGTASQRMIRNLRKTARDRSRAELIGQD